MLVRGPISDRARCCSGRPMGVVLGTIREALAWSGSQITLSLFAVIAAQAASRFSGSLEGLRPRRVAPSEVEDEACILGGRSV